MRAIRDFFELIKFEHTVFALPFAYLGMLLAAGGLPTLWQFVWITVAMVGARTLAMGTNRLADRQQDAQNPRTRSRPLVTGKTSLRTAWMGTIASGVLLVFSAWMLGPLPLALSPIAIFFLVGYSFTKRFTTLSHFILGFVDGLAPAGAWVAVRGTLFTWDALPAWCLLGVVTFWIGGFDLLYACQDVEFDRQYGLHSVPAKYGVAFALRLSLFSHAITLLLLGGVGALMRLGYPYWIGLVIAAGLLYYEHSLVKPDDLSKIDVAFFNINSYISICLLASVCAALFLI